MHTYYIDTGEHLLTHIGTPEFAVQIASHFCYISQKTREKLSNELAATGHTTAFSGLTCIEIYRK
jgi:hypothetical protein